MHLPIISSLISYLLPASTSSQIPLSSHQEPTYITFAASHEHALSFLPNSSTPITLFRNASNSLLDGLLSLRLRSVPTRVYRPRSQQVFHEGRRNGRMSGQLLDVPWDEDVVPGPDVSDRETVLLLAKMTSNAYTSPENSDWYPLGDRWNYSEPFGWEPDADGFRGHIFVSTDSPPTVVLSIKGTSVPVVAPGPSSGKDKLNDNLLFSCCCARVSPTWSTVCDCFSGGWKCDLGCLSEALKEESLFYTVGTSLYNNLTYMYPDANIWVTGHSLGGSIAGLLGLTFGVPVVSFEAPPEKLASRRLHLPLPPSDDHLVHIYHTADPLAVGTCNGITSVCNAAGYALETKCHNGRTIRYNTVEEKGWGVSVRTHSIVYIINYLLNEDWNANVSVPEASREYEEGCIDCYKWEFGDWLNTTDAEC
ncbi:alpha/beta-hydrolase [Dacryopinax primogenitus]|uniref:triacylglycerol lipase n=1 Tax=Dacryopinax primogenitus (strain DJM 731) TaxID=1858805 RepID=M5GFP7_DACPD|nr:alpha/beta-hydrolase [Dacryopinax primogenitus]EJU04303.1 alpha/beta-hydrolase [Dacryopinax primogenitus]